MVADTRPRIGVTCRVTHAQGYVEARDSLAQDWIGFFESQLPEALWQLLPNRGRDAPRHFAAWGLNALILSGGNSLGEEPVKDETDIALLEYALDNDIPVLGICRGMQVMHHYFGGRLQPADKTLHVRGRHFLKSTSVGTIPAFTLEVNSYHTQCIRADELTDAFHPLALCGDGTVEAMCARDHRAYAVMWHPERDALPDPLTRHFLKILAGMDHD